MSSAWLKNFVGIKQNDFELLQIPQPAAEFCVHVTLRSMQTGAILGSILGPLSALIFKDQQVKSRSLLDSAVSGGCNGALIGTAIGPVLTYLSLRNMNTLQLYDKCYRLRFDQHALWQDRTAVVSAAVGYLSSGSLGLVVGLDLALLMSNVMGRAW